jgi:hypothetical protein
MQNISLYIPHIFSNFTRGDVAYQFERLDIGEIERVDFVAKISANGVPYNAAYIHFRHWNENPAARNLQERVLNPNKEAHLVYEDPWYWICLENKTRKYNPSDRKKRISVEELFVTPKKEAENVDMPLAPTKMTRMSTTPSNITPLNLQQALASAAAAEIETPEWSELTHIFGEEVVMDDKDDDLEDVLCDIERLMDEEDEFLVTIDGRYISEIEQENIMLRNQLNSMTISYFEEMNKSLQFKHMLDSNRFGQQQV